MFSEECASGLKSVGCGDVKNKSVQAVEKKGFAQGG